MPGRPTEDRKPVGKGIWVEKHAERPAWDVWTQEKVGVVWREGRSVFRAAPADEVARPLPRKFDSLEDAALALRRHSRT